MSTAISLTPIPKPGHRRDPLSPKGRTALRRPSPSSIASGRNLKKSYGNVVALDEPEPGHPRRRTAGPAGAERRRQDHAGAHAAWVSRVLTPAAYRCSEPIRTTANARPAGSHAPGGTRARDAEGPRTHRSLLVVLSQSTAAGKRRSRSPASSTSKTGLMASCRAGRSSACCSASRSAAIPICCFSTSPQLVSMWKRAA